MQAPPANFYERIADAARRFGDRPAIEMADAAETSLTYRELMATAARFATWLAIDGRVARGDRVAILAGNDGRWVAAYLGVLRIGAVAVPLDVSYSAGQVRTILMDCAPRVLLTSVALHDVGQEAITGLPCPPKLATLAKHIDVHRDDTPVALVDDGDAAAILYTSGTTADPKGVVLTHRNLEAERAAALAVIVVNEDDVVLGVLPLFHALAQMANLLLPLSAGARVVFLRTIDSTTLLDTLQTRGITVFACVPQFFYLIHQRVLAELERRNILVRVMFRLLLRSTSRLRDTVGLNPGPLLFARVHRTLGPRVRMFITGGSRFDPEIARDLHGLGLTLLNGYGLTETSGAATVMRPADRFTTSVGHPLPGVEVRIEPALEMPGDDVEPGTGEILIRGDVVMREYFNRPDASAAVLGPDGWLRTGDLGRIDSDGRLFITGRLKDIIILASGKNLYPEEIEAHYQQSTFIREICVLGVTDATTPASERLHGLVVTDADVLRERGVVNQVELVRFEMETLSVLLPAHKRVLSYEISPAALLRTTTGKLRRQEIAASYARRGQNSADNQPVSSADDRRWAAAGDRQALLDLLAVWLKRSSIRPGDHLEFDLHLDSLERVELLAMIEQRSGVRLDSTCRASLFTVQQLIESIETAPALEAGITPAETGTAAEWSRLLESGATDATPAANLVRAAGLRAFAFFVVLKTLLVLLRVFARVDVIGREHLDFRGPVILTPNHQSHLDGFLLAAVLPLRALKQLFFVGASEYFAGAWLRRLANAANIVPVDADANLVLAMQSAAAGLRRGLALVLFPEGERSIDGTVRPFRRGAAILASRIGTPVIPIGVTGTYDLWPRGRPFDWRRLLTTRPRLVIAAGAPLTAGQQSSAEFTREIEGEVAAAIHRTCRQGD